MSRMLPRAILLLATLSTLQNNPMEAYCSRCVKIEEERAKEQAETPQPQGYFDDRVDLHQTAGKQPLAESETAKETNGGGSGDLSGATVRSSTGNYEGSQKKDKDQPAERQGNGANELNTGRKQFSYLADAFLQAQPQEAAIISPSTKEKLMNEFFEESTYDDRQNKNVQQGNPESQNTRKKPASSSYATLFTIVKTKDLLETLDGEFTLLIPTDEALQELPQGTFEELIKPENANKLGQLISNHIIAKKLLKKDFEKYNKREIKAISGRNLTVSIEKGNLSIEDAHVISIEPAGYDGVILVIDKVLQ